MQKHFYYFTSIPPFIGEGVPLHAQHVPQLCKSHILISKATEIKFSFVCVPLLNFKQSGQSISQLVTVLFKTVLIVSGQDFRTDLPPLKLICVINCTYMDVT